MRYLAIMAMWWLASNCVFAQPTKEVYNYDIYWSELPVNVKAGEMTFAFRDSAEFKVLLYKVSSTGIARLMKEVDYSIRTTLINNQLFKAEYVMKDTEIFVLKDTLLTLTRLPHRPITRKVDSVLVWDPLTAFYFSLRSDYVVGDAADYKVWRGFEGADKIIRLVNKPVRITCVQLEKITVPCYSGPAYKLMIIVEGEPWLFSEKKFYLWLSADDRRMPVQLIGRMSFGEMTAKLVSTNK